MPTTFTSLRVKLTAYVGGALTVIGAVAISGALTGTTGNFTTSASGAILYGGGGTQTITANGARFTTMEADTISGSTIRTTSNSFSILDATGTASGAKLAATPKTGTAGLVLYGGAKGTHICYADSDGSGFTACDANNGTQTCRVSTSGLCP